MKPYRFSINRAVIAIGEVGINLNDRIAIASA
jgi:hypothetical protein